MFARGFRLARVRLVRGRRHVGWLGVHDRLVVARRLAVGRRVDIDCRLAIGGLHVDGFRRVRLVIALDRRPMDQLVRLILVIAAERRPKVPQSTAQRPTHLRKAFRSQHQQCNHKDKQEVSGLKNVADHEQTAYRVGGAGFSGSRWSANKDALRPAPARGVGIVAFSGG